MRHSKIDLTMNVYTDPKLLDVAGALDSLPSLNLDALPSAERQTMRATGTDQQDRTPKRDCISSSLVPNTGKPREAVSFGVISWDDADERMPRRSTHTDTMISSEKTLPAVFASKAFRVETTGIEPATSGLQSQRSPS